jgi:hypothetical protein
MCQKSLALPMMLILLRHIEHSQSLYSRNAVSRDLRVLIAGAGNARTKYGRIYDTYSFY